MRDWAIRLANLLPDHHSVGAGEHFCTNLAKSRFLHLRAMTFQAMLHKQGLNVADEVDLLCRSGWQFCRGILWSVFERQEMDASRRKQDQRRCAEQIFPRA